MCVCVLKGKNRQTTMYRMSIGLTEFADIISYRSNGRSVRRMGGHLLKCASAKIQMGKGLDEYHAIMMVCVV